MTDPMPAWREELVLVLAPTPRDAALSGKVLAEAGIACTPCADLEAVCREWEAGAGAAVLTQEALGPEAAGCLVAALGRQPPWSDFPLLVLTPGGSEPTALWALEHLGNVTLLEAPVRVATLVSAVRAALRARRRQYQIRDHLTAAAEAAAALQESEARLRLALAAGRLGAWELDVATGALAASATCKANFGLSPESELSYPGLLRAIHPDDRERVREAVRAALDGQTEYEAEYRTVGADGVVRWIIARGRAVYSAAGRPLRMVGVTLDITQRKLAEEALKEADRRKDEFLAMLAHELRNPLAPIRTGLHVLRLPEASGPQVEQVRAMMERQVQHLTRLVDDLLDVGRILRGRIELRREVLELATVIARAVETAQPAIAAQGHRLTVTLSPDPVRLDGDLVRLAQVFANLLTNAARYTERAGQIWLTAEREGTEVVVRVRDTGIGIRPEALPHVFELFVQADPSIDRSRGGLGIGLTLVRRLVELHGGRVSAVSGGVNQGSEFTVRLPALPEPPPNGEVRRPEGEARGLPPSPRRILVVDDNTDAAASLAIVLRLSGHTVQTAPDGPAALEAARAFQPEVVFLDLGLPGMDGYEVARHLRQQPGADRVLLVALTGYGQEEDRRRTRQAGFDHHLTKPVDPNDLQPLLVRPT